jgi:hypothetical protein
MEAEMRMPKTVRGVAAAAAVAIVALLVTASGALASTSPLVELGQARSQVQAQIGQADSSGKGALNDAVDELSVATAPSLWSGPSEPVPPPYGDAVFNGAEAALEALARIRHDPTISQSALTAASSAIVNACAEVASAARQQAGLGGHPRSGSVQRAQGEFDSAFHVLGVTVTHEATGVPQSTIEAAASNYLSSEKGELLAIPQSITGPTLTVKRKPEFFYFGAEGCPFCGVDRWSVVVALAQFGTFPPLALSVSSPIEIDPSTRTFTFYESSFTSPYVAFVPVERYTNQPNRPGEPPLCGGESAYPWSVLQTPTPSEQELVTRYDGFEPCPGVAAVIPFLDIANTWATLGSYPNPAVIAGMSWQQIAGSLSNPGSLVGQAIDGGAEIVTAQICEVDGGQPARVCTSGVVRRYQQEVKSGFR